jgi:hypothetical protein
MEACMVEFWGGGKRVEKGGTETEVWSAGQFFRLSLRSFSQPPQRLGDKKK